MRVKDTFFTWAHFLGFTSVAGGYYITGKLGLLLAIPPGYATAVWPPSGIALAALLILGPRYYPSIFLGSLLLNLELSLDASSHAALLRSIATASSIALGASLQALTGAYLIRRIVGTSTQLDNERDVILTMTLGGPLACLLNAVWGTTTLWLTGAVATSAYLYTWWIWWVGDSIGVLIFTPLILLWARSSLSPSIWRSRPMMVTLPLCVCFGLVVWIYVQASAWEVQVSRHRFNERADVFHDAMNSRIASYVEVLATLRDLHSEGVLEDRHAFDRFANHLLSRHPGILALSWNPRVVRAERNAYEAGIRGEGHAGFHILEKNGTGELYPAAEREVYFPIRFIEPEQNNQMVLGIDASTDKIRAEAMQRAIDSSLPTATAWTPLLQSETAEMGLLVYQPVYRSGRVPDTPEQRRVDIEGFLVGVFKLSDLISTAMEDQPQSDIEFQLYDASSPPEERYLLSTSGSLQRWPLEPEKVEPHSLEWNDTEAIGGRQWKLRALPTQAYRDRNRSWQTWALLAGGLLFTGLVGALLLVVTGRTRHISQLVEQRTQELAHANQRLTEEVTRRSASELGLQEKNIELENANAAKDRFLATMSHELRTPLNAIIGFTGTLLMRLPGPLNDEQQKQLQTIQGSARHLLSLINDLLDLAKIESGKVSISSEPASCLQIIEEVMATLRPLADAKGLAFQLESEITEVMVQTDRRALSQIVINLASNAIKYTEHGSVGIGLRLKEDAGAQQVEISIRDTGCGISQEDQTRLFRAFNQLDNSSTRRHEGSGLGLYLSQKFAGLLGGCIRFSSEPGKGSTFTVAIPAR